MKTLLISTAALAMIVTSPMTAEAKGCIKGAIVGGVAGHVAGHGKLGAVAGCIVGHHEANKKQKTAKANAQAQSSTPGK